MHQEANETVPPEQHNSDRFDSLTRERGHSFLQLILCIFLAKRTLYEYPETTWRSRLHEHIKTRNSNEAENEI